MVAALRPLAVGHGAKPASALLRRGRRELNSTRDFQRANCSRTGVLPREPVVHSVGLAACLAAGLAPHSLPLSLVFSPQQPAENVTDSVRFWPVMPTRAPPLLQTRSHHRPCWLGKPSICMLHTHSMLTPCSLHARAACGPAAASSESAIGVDSQISFTMPFAI